MSKCMHTCTRARVSACSPVYLGGFPGSRLTSPLGPCGTTSLRPSVLAERLGLRFTVQVGYDAGQ